MILTFTEYNVTTRNTRTGKTTRANFKSEAEALNYAEHMGQNPPDKVDVYETTATRKTTSYQVIA